MNDLRPQIADALAAFAQRPLAEAATDFFATLGYRSEKRLALDNTPEAFLAQFDRPEAPLNRDRALVAHWQSIDLLFQMTDEEVTGERSLFDAAVLNTGQLKSYLFFAIRLREADYPRGQFAAIARAINRLFSIPVMILFSHGEKLSATIINRRAHKRDPARDVLEKVSLIKDIACARPHRGHLDVLASFALAELARARPIRSFDDLHEAWAERLNIELLNRRFYQRIQEWFFWAAQSVRFPHGGIANADLRNRIALIRMLTRIVFCWFARQKGLIPTELFTPETARRVLKRFDPADATEGGFYLAILQNLFFPTLAVPLDQREFRNGRRYRGVNKHYMDHRFYRHAKLFQDPEGFGALFERIPFLNGGLFECLDTGTGKADEVRVDGFSDEPRNQPLVPDVLFFGREVHADLHAAYGSSKKRDVKVDGLFRILDAYTFTVTENTPVEEEIALDPELLGRIFEELLAECNPVTERTMRKETGSFYTPRAIVDYMAGESLKAYLERELIRRVPRCASADTRAGLELLFAYTEKEQPFDEEERQALVDAVYDVRAFDPACGSGAFPMGMLQKLVFILEKLDCDHRRWKTRILDDTPPAIREETKETLERHGIEYAWKLALIQHSIYGADIQPIAVQIAKLRCFISLLVDFKVDPKRDDKGVTALPNLDFKFVAANSLIPAPGEHTVRAGELALTDEFFDRFAKAAEDYFYVRDPDEKRELRKRIEALIAERIGAKEAQLANEIQTVHGVREDLRREMAERNKAGIARAERERALWESYRNLFAFRNAPVGFFDVRYFFPEVKDGFDITIGNPPYVRADEPSEWNRAQRTAIMECEAYETLWEKWDLFVPFIERAYKLLRPDGVSTLIVSDAFCHSKYAQKPQNWFLQNARILRLDFCADLKIFDAAVHNLIYFFQKADGTRNKPERRLHTGEFGVVTDLPTGEQGKLTYRAFFPEKGEQRAFGADVGLLDAICYISVGMVVHADEKVAQGSFELEDLVSETKDKRHPKPFVEGKHLARWLPETHKWLEWGTSRAPTLFRRRTFPELYAVPGKIFIHRTSGREMRSAFDSGETLCNHTVMVCVPWHLLAGVRNKSLKKAARYKDEKPPRPSLPQREELEKASRRFAVKYLLAVMNSSVARDFLRAHRRSNTDLYPDDWKKLPIPAVDAKAQAPIVNLVDRILAAKRADPAADIAALEKQVDDMVTALYGVDREAGAAGLSVQKDLKDRLREDVIPMLLLKQPYCSIPAIRAELARRHIEFDRLTLNRYMVELHEAGFLHDAGKGWYSSVARELVLDTQPLQEIITLLTVKYPLLSFACWSTEQVQNYVQHTLNKSVTFVYTGKDAVRPVFDTLRSAGWDAYLDPKPAEARKTFVVRGKTVVVRDTRAKEMFTSDHVVSAERLLVYLHLEGKRLSLMDEGEYSTMARRLIESGRINMGMLQALADDHKVGLLAITGVESAIAED